MQASPNRNHSSCGFIQSGMASVLRSVPHIMTFPFQMQAPANFFLSWIMETVSTIEARTVLVCMVVKLDSPSRVFVRPTRYPILHPVGAFIVRR